MKNFQSNFIEGFTVCKVCVMCTVCRMVCMVSPHSASPQTITRDSRLAHTRFRHDAGAADATALTHDLPAAHLYPPPPPANPPLGGGFTPSFALSSNSSWPPSAVCNKNGRTAPLPQAQHRDGTPYADASRPLARYPSACGSPSSSLSSRSHSFLNPPSHPKRPLSL